MNLGHPEAEGEGLRYVLPQECTGTMLLWCPERSGRLSSHPPFPRVLSCHLCGNGSLITVHVTGGKTEAQNGVPSLAPNGIGRQNFPWEHQAGSGHPLPRPCGPELQSFEPSGIQAEFAGCQTSEALRMNSELANSFCLLSLGGGRSDLAGPEGVQAEV